MHKIVAVLAAVTAIGACALPPALPGASLPLDAVVGAGDPIRAAVANTSSAFADQGRLANQPARAARALAQMEFLTVELPSNGRYTNGSGTVGQELMAARQEWRAALGIPAELPPQPVINGLYAAARALDNGQGDAAAALSSPVFSGGGAATLGRLAALPPLPRTNFAAVQAADTLRRHDGQGRGRF